MPALCLTQRTDRGIGEDVFTQGKTLDELMSNVKEAVSLHFEDRLPRGPNVDVLIVSEMEGR